MRIRTTHILGTGLVIAALVVTPVATEAASPRSGSNITLASSLTQSAGQSSPSSSPSATDTNTTTTLQQRITEFESKFKVKLTSAQQELIKAKCLSNQAIVKTLGSKVNANVPQRVNAYKELDSHLTDITAKLKAVGLDTAQLQAENSILATKISTFNTDLATYKQDLSDLQTVSCIQDPTGFQAALDAARAQRDTLVADMQDITTYVTGTIKPTLATLRAQLQAKESTGENQ